MSNTKIKHLNSAAVSARLDLVMGHMSDIRDKAEKIQALDERIQSNEAAGRNTPADVHHQHEELTQKFYEMGIPYEGGAIKGLMAGLNLALSELSDLKHDLDQLQPKQEGTTAAEFARYAGLMKHRKELPEGFDQWGLVDSVGQTLAHVAARHGYLPADFKGWSWVNPDDGRTVAHVAAMYGHLPKDFYNWEMTDESGWSVGHVAADYNTLPKNFSRIGLCNKYGTTVAHVLAIHDRLPEWFGDWGMCDRKGWSVAHEAAKHGTLPGGFDRWDISDINGWSVAHTAAEFGLLPDGFSQWHLRNNEGVSVAQIHRENGYDLPEDFDQWDLVAREYRPDYREDSCETPKMGM